MSCFLPGTQIDIGKKNYGQIDIAESVMDNIFQTGGLMLSQVIAMTSLEGYMIQNWVKRGFRRRFINCIQDVSSVVL